MKTQILSTAQCKRFRANPTEARKQRDKLQQRTQQLHSRGHWQAAWQTGQHALEIAVTALQALHSDNTDAARQQDILSFGALALFLAQSMHWGDEHQAAHTLLTQAHDQLTAILPLHATSPQLCTLVWAVQTSLQGAHARRRTLAPAAQRYH